MEDADKDEEFVGAASFAFLLIVTVVAALYAAFGADRAERILNLGGVVVFVLVVAFAAIALVWTAGDWAYKHVCHMLKGRQ